MRDIKDDYITLVQAQQLAQDGYGIFSKREIYNLCIDSVIDCEQDEQTKRWLIKAILTYTLFMGVVGIAFYFLF